MTHTLENNTDDENHRHGQSCGKNEEQQDQQADQSQSTCLYV